MCANCQSGRWKGVEKLLVLSGSYEPSTCDYWLWYEQRICYHPPYGEIVFPEKFSKPPKILVSVTRNFPYTPCAGGASDAQDFNISDIDENGFLLAGGASPSGNSCGSIISDGRTISKYDWIAVGLKP